MPCKATLAPVVGHDLAERGQLTEKAKKSVTILAQEYFIR